VNTNGIVTALVILAFTVVVVTALAVTTTGRPTARRFLAFTVLVVTALAVNTNGIVTALVFLAITVIVELALTVTAKCRLTTLAFAEDMFFLDVLPSLCIPLFHFNPEQIIISSHLSIFSSRRKMLTYR
jgi:hypothetical protein